MTSRLFMPRRRAVGIWLFIVAAMIAAMVLVGGLTRLTGSGLSITEWQPVSGAIPPLSHHAWMVEFDHYKQIPQYRFENSGMTLAQFKGIFWWEWAHRLLGRLIGFVFFVPFLWFAWRGAIRRREWPRMIVLFFLGGLQGFVGWWMVESGIETSTRVSVSQYRLATHLGLALILFAAIVWTALEYLRSPPPGTLRAPASPQGRREINIARLSLPPLGRGDRTVGARSATAVWAGGYVLVALVYVQMLLGALVAGLHAGLIYNTWPSMDGAFLPEHPMFQSPWWLNFFANPGLVQFDHRIGAYVSAATVLALWIWGAWLHLAGRARISQHVVLVLVFVQIALGINTLLMQTPIDLSSAHQVTALILFTAAIWQAFEIRMLFYPAKA